MTATKSNKQAAPVVKGTAGRPPKYKPEYAEKAYKFCLLGMNNIQLSEAFDVHLDTIYTWIKTIPEFSERLSEGRECADAEIAKSLYHRAKGYSHPEEDIKVVAGNIVITPTVKHYPPDTTAASLWLRNRQSDKWRDKTEQEISGKNGNPIEIDVKIGPDDAYLQMIGK